VNIEVPYIGAKWTIGFLGLFHTAVAALSIGFAFVVTVAQIVGYLQRDRRYDLLGKRVQLIHVCIYNIGTVVAIGLVFALSGLYPQFWSQLFVHLFWTIMVEELFPRGSVEPTVSSAILHYQRDRRLHADPGLPGGPGLSVQGYPRVG
jgi:hypothetical protein